MRLGALEIVLIIAVILSVAFVWRWLRVTQPADEDYEEDEPEGQPPAEPSRLWDIGLILVLAGLGLLVAGYIVITGLAKIFIWAAAILLLGVAFLLLSRR